MAASMTTVTIFLQFNRRVLKVVVRGKAETLGADIIVTFFDYWGNRLLGLRFYKGTVSRKSCVQTVALVKSGRFSA